MGKCLWVIPTFDWHRDLLFLRYDWTRGSRLNISRLRASRLSIRLIWLTWLYYSSVLCQDGMPVTIVPYILCCYGNKSRSFGTAVLAAQWVGRWDVWMCACVSESVWGERGDCLRCVAFSSFWLAVLAQWLSSCCAGFSRDSHEEGMVGVCWSLTPNTNHRPRPRSQPQPHGWRGKLPLLPSAFGSGSPNNASQDCFFGVLPASQEESRKPYFFSWHTKEGPRQ